MTRFVTKTTLCSTLAIATAMIMAPRAAQAQAFIGTVSSSTGVDAPINGATTTFINVTAPQAVINWDTTGAAAGGVVTFQGSGTTATFSSGGADFAVLNRVNANGNAIKLDGTINSQVGDFAGGTVYFSSADGIIIGSNAVINVGSLGLTTLPIVDDGQGNWVTGFGTSSPQVTFGPTASPFASITTESGSQLKANGAGNYVAMVTPKITHSGTILTDGGAALVGANAATITFSNSNLYTIQVDVPSDAYNAVTVDGGKINANNVALAADRRAYLVTMAPNNTNTILITGGADLGFATATTASTVGNAVVLSAGGGVYGGDPYWDINSFGFAEIDGATISSNFKALGRNGIKIGDATGATNFSGDVNLLTQGGDINIIAAGHIQIDGNLDANASFFGGDGQGATGNTINIVSDGASASILVQGDTFLTADGYGGNGNSDLSAGNGTGGTIAVVAANDAVVDLQGNLTASATGHGGSPQYGSLGVAGTGTGGLITVAADVGADSAVHLRGQTSLVANGQGGSNSDGDAVTGGAGQGGTVAVRASGSAGNYVDTADTLHAEASGTGGSGDIAGGNGTGGTVTVSTMNGASLIVYNPTLIADGQGGASYGGVGGTGQGGTATLAIGSGSIGSFLGDIRVVANGTGGDGAGGGSGFGGFTTLSSAGALTLYQAGDFPGTVTVSSKGQGGNATTESGGLAAGGTATLQLNAGGIVTLTGDVLLDTSADGGDNGEVGDITNGAGGNAFGGASHIYLFSPSAVLDITGTTTLDSGATGGSSIAHDGGTGTGGMAGIYATGGTARFGGDTIVQANATGGGSTDGDGATGTGGKASVTSLTSAFTFDGALSVHADAIGGYGVNGGNAIGGDNGGFIVSGLIARNGGSIAVAGNTTLTATTLGGAAHSNGEGGDAASSFQTFDANNVVTGGGWTGIVVSGNTNGAGSVMLAGLNVDTSAVGGVGGGGVIGLDGGKGGAAHSGDIQIVTRNSDSGINLISADSMSVNADATGGNGGLGGDGSRAGGNGGDATSGVIGVAASAGNGRVAATTLTISGIATGGDGGRGGFADFPFVATGNGGNGGNAIASGSGVGLVSVGESTTNYGSAALGTVIIDYSAHGGAGGDAGGGSPTLGSAGNGGYGAGGSVTLYSRGGDVQIGSMTVDARGFGGDGGFSNIGGVGGNGYAGSIQALSTTRYLHPEQAGSMNVGSFIGDASAYAGGGVTAGQALIETLGIYYTAIGIQVTGGSSAHFGDVSIVQNAADGIGSAASNNFLQVINGTLTVDGGLSLITDADLQVLVDSGSVSAGSVNLSAGDFILNAAPVTSVGTISADSINITTGNDLDIVADLISTGIENSLFLNAPGHVNVYNLTSVNDVYVSAGNYIFATNVNAGGSITFDAQSSIQSSNLNAGLDINLSTITGPILFGNAVAGRDFDFQGGSTADGFDITAGRNIGGSATGAVTFGNLSAGFANPYGPTSDGFSIGFGSETSVTVGTVDGAEAIGFVSLGALTTGDLTAGTDVLAMVSGTMDLGAISAGPSGRVYLADSSMFTNNGGTFGNGGDTFDPAVVFAAAPVASGGAILINGPVSGGSLQAAAGTDFTSGAINVGGVASVSAGGQLTAQDIMAGSDIRLDGNLGVAVGNLTAGDSVYARSLSGAISTGNIVAVAGVSPYNVQLSAATTLDTGTIDASGFVLLVAGTDLSAGAINASAELLGFAGGSMTLGAVNAAYVLLGDDAMAAAGGDPFGSYLPSAAIAQAAVRSGGSITIGNVSAGGINASAGGNFSGGTLAGFNELTIDSGGNVSAASLQTLGTDLVTADGAIAVAGATGGAAVDFTAGTTIATGAISADGNAKLLAGGNLTTGNVLAGQRIDLDSGGAISTGSMTAGGSVEAKAAGNIVTGNLSAGLVNQWLANPDNYVVALNGGGSVTTGNIAAIDYAGLAAVGSLTTGTVSAGLGILAMVSGDMSFGSINSSGSVYLADQTMMALGGDIGGTFDPAPVLAAIPVRSGGAITIGGATTAQNFQAAAGTSFTSGAISTPGGFINIDAGGAIATGALTSAASTTLLAGGNISVGAVRSASYTDLDAGGSLTATTISAGDSVSLWGQTGVSTGDIDAGIVAQDTSPAATYHIGIGSGPGGNINTGVLTAAGDVAFGAGGNLSTGAIQGGGNMLAMVGGNATFGAVTVPGILGVTGYDMVGVGGGKGNFDPAIVFAALIGGTATQTGGDVTFTGAVDASSIYILAGGNVQSASLTTGTGNLYVDAGGNVSTGALSGAAGLSVNAGGSLAVTGGIGAVGPIDLGAGTTLTGGNVNGNDFLASAGGNISLGNIDVVLGTDLTSTGGSITTGTILANTRAARLLASGNIAVGAVRSATFTDLDAGGTLTATTISAGGDVSLWGQNGVVVGAIDAGIVNPDISVGATYNIGIGSGAGGDITTGVLSAAGDVTAAAGGNLTTGAIQSGGDVLAMVGGDAVFGAVNLPGTLGVTGYDMVGVGGGKGNFDPAIVFAALVGGTATRTGGDVTFTGAVDASSIYILAGGSIFGLDFGGIDELLLDAGGDVDVGSLITGGNIDASAGGSLLINGVLSGFALNLSAGTDLTIGDITSNSAISFSAAGNLTVGNLTTVPSGFRAPFAAAAAIAPSALDISLRSGGNLTAGVLTSAGSIYLGADGGITTLGLNAANAVLALAAGDISTGAITAGDVVYVAGIGNEARGGTIGATFDPNPVVASAPTSAAASITTGAISGGDLTLAATGDISLPSATSTGAVSIAGGNVTAGSLSGLALGVTATGLASVNGIWAGGPVNIVANDLAIGASGAVQGGAVRIESTNANGMFLGDGLSGSGFMLSQAEASQVSGATLAFASTGGTSPAMTIGNLSLNAGQMSGSELMQFSAGGSIRIVGDLAINGIADPASAIGFYTPLFMLDAGTGSLAMNNGSQLGGTLNIYAHDVWVADGAILGRLLADPNYAGRDAELAVAPNGVSGPVISANVINVQFQNGGPRTVTPYTLLVQNTGDATTRQGFLATDANATLGEGASGLIDMVINGQGQTSGGLISGVAVRDALMAGDDPARFTATSTINGCSVAGGDCGATPPPPPPPPIVDPGNVIAEIVLISLGGDAKPLFGNEQQIVQNLDDLLVDNAGVDPSDPATVEEQEKKDKEAAEEASSPIAPPTPLFDTRPLNAKDSTDEPISGGGNPALIGSGVEPTGGQQ